VLTKGFRRRKRWGLLFGALILILLAGVAAEKASVILNTEITRDTREEERAAREEQAAQEAQKETVNEEGETELTRQFSESQPQPAYRQEGKKEREKGKKERIDIDVDELAPEEKEIVYMNSRLMSRLQQVDRLNRFLIILLMWTTLGILLWDYLKAFNAVLTTDWLLPIGGPWLDSFSPRTRMLLVTPTAAAGRLSSEYYAETALRKGEQLIYFGAEDPWHEQSVLARLSLGSWRIWGVKKLVAGAPGVSPEPEFLLDGAWFGHYAVVVPDPGNADAILAEQVRILRQRQGTQAKARRTVHIVWALPTRPDAETITQLQSLGDRVNVSLAVWSADGNLSPDENETFDMICSEPLEPDLQILDELRARSQGHVDGDPA
jgi:hypothetical protein